MKTLTRPIDRALAQLWPDARPGSNGWYSAKCTGHTDTSPSLSIKEGDNGGVILKCHAGCTREAILQSAHITEKVLHVKGSYRPAYKPQPKYDLISLAHDKLLPWQFLFNEGVIDGYKWHNSEVVQITYYDQVGDAYDKIRLRLGPSGNKDSYWDEDTPGLLIPYGYQWLDLASQKGYVLLGEGESDGWTCRYHDIPYLGVPGANNANALDGSLLNDIPELYVIQEPDAAGQGFYKNVHRRLRETGYTGKMFACPWQKLTGWKDPNELHRMIRIKDPNDTHAGFQTKIAEVLKGALPAGDDIRLEVSKMNAEEWISRAAYDELREQFHEVKGQRDFILQVIAVPHEVMSPTDKIVNIIIDDELRNKAPDENGFIPARMTNVAKRTDCGYSTVIKSKKRLEKSLGLYEQHKVSFFHDGPNGTTTQTDSIFLKPAPQQKFPRLYGTKEPIEWGGKRRQCPECGSENIDIQVVTLCHDCHKISHKEIYTSKEPLFHQTAVIVTPYDGTEQANTTDSASIDQVDIVPTPPTRLYQLDTTPHKKPEIHTDEDSIPVFLGTDEEYQAYVRQEVRREQLEREQEIQRKVRKAKVQAG